MSAAPIYPLSKIKTAQYTRGNELIIDNIDQNEYVGLYHILPNGEYWTEPSPNDKSIKLTEKQLKVSTDVKLYRQINNLPPTNYVDPISYYPILKPEDYQTGYIMRCFVQKRNNPYLTIQEITPQQFNSINTTNKQGISGLTWNSTEIKWSIKGVHAEMLNSQEIRKAEQDGFINLSNFLKNTLEFWK
jgi:hypothetical protein